MEKDAMRCNNTLSEMEITLSQQLMSFNKSLFEKGTVTYLVEQLLVGLKIKNFFFFKSCN